MFKNPLRNIEPFETIAIVGLGIILLITLEPVSQTQLILAGILGGLLVAVIGLSLWEQRQHER